MFPRYARTLPRRLQDVRTDDVIMTCKAYRHEATVSRWAADRLRARLVGAITRQDGTVLHTTRNVAERQDKVHLGP
jgi:hypothetical protein